MVEYLDALARAPEPPEELRANFLRVVEELGAWTSLESGFTISQEEEADFENLRASLQRLAGPAVVDTLLEESYAALRVMREVEAGRARAEYARDPLVNGVILCGVAVLQGRGEIEALHRRLPALRGYGQAVREMLHFHQPQIRPEVAEAFETGLNSWDAAVDGLQQGERLQASLARLKEAAEIVQHLVDYDRRELAPPILRIPRLGQALDFLLETQQREMIARLLDETVPDFDRFWERAQQSLVAPEPERSEWLEQIWHLADALVEELKRVGEGAELEPLADICSQMSDAFVTLTSLAPDSTHLRGTQAGDYYTYMSGLLRRTLPAHGIPNLLRLSPPPAAWSAVVAALEAFRLSGDGHEIRQGMLEILRLCPPVEGALAPDFWNCPYCGKLMAVGERTCAHCNATPGLADLEAREFLA